jgi:hypothetical protein
MSGTKAGLNIQPKVSTRSSRQDRASTASIGVDLRSSCLKFVTTSTILWAGFLTLPLVAQSHALEKLAFLSNEKNIAALPDGPAPQLAAQSSGSISGNVVDPTGAIIPGATVTLSSPQSKTQRIQTDSTGSFRFADIKSGSFKVTITAPGFSPWAATNVAVEPGQNYEFSQIQIPLAEATTEIEVFPSPHAEADYQIHLEEKQRILGLFPNFYVSYIPNALPLSSGQKFRLALRTVIDPATFAGPAAAAGISQAANLSEGYGQGMQGYAKRFGAGYLDGFDSIMIGGAILPSILHQDPRYFHRGKGSLRSRALYALSTAVICKGDNGKWQPNYSNVLGNLASGALSNLYYPASSRHGAGLTIGNAFVGIAGGAVGNIFQELLFKKISTGIRH